MNQTGRFAHFLIRPVTNVPLANNANKNLILTDATVYALGKARGRERVGRPF